MVKWLSIFLFVFLIGISSFAQKNALIIEGTSPDLYLIHKVVPKENFYSIGRMYNVSPKDIASYNNLQFENGLSVGESLKIPLNSNNFSQSTSVTGAETLIPVYHHVQPKEGLYRVSVNYNKVPLSTIKQWNHLSSDEVTIGTSLIVGYLKVNKDESKLASGSLASDEPVVSNNSQSKPKPTPPIINEEKLPPAQSQAEQEKKEVTSNPSVDIAPTVTNTTSGTKGTVNFSGGYFKKLYNDQLANKSPVDGVGSAGVFKSTSGWQDGKYYCFNNDAPPGSVIKVTNNATNKSVYAKVLDAIPDIKQNSGLSIIISNSAAEELGAENAKFDCLLSYVK